MIFVFMAVYGIGWAQCVDEYGELIGNFEEDIPLIQNAQSWFKYHY